MASGTGSNTVVTPSLKLSELRFRLQEQQTRAGGRGGGRGFVCRTVLYKPPQPASLRVVKVIGAPNRSPAFAHTTQAIERRLAKNDLTKVIEASGRKQAFEVQAPRVPLTMLVVWAVHARARYSGAD